MKTRIINSLLLTALATTIGLLSGCSTYRLGSMLPEGVHTIYVPTFINETDQPFIEADTTRATIDQLQVDGSLKIARNDKDADAVLNVTLIDYSLTPLTYDTLHKTAANEYRLIISARVLVTSTSDGKVIAENPVVQGDTTFEIHGDLTTSKNEALPRCAKKLAERIVDSVVEYW